MPTFKIKLDNKENEYDAVIAVRRCKNVTDRQMDVSSKKTPHETGRDCAKSALKMLEPAVVREDIRMCNNIMGKPFLKGNIESGYGISISHTPNIAAAVAFKEECPLSIDLEIIREKNIKVFERFYNMHEKKLCQNIQGLKPEVIYTIIWTAKEALGKMLGVGIFSNFKVLEIKEVKKSRHGYDVYFKNFPQFIVKSFSSDKMSISLCMAGKVDFRF